MTRESVAEERRRIREEVVENMKEVYALLQMLKSSEEGDRTTDGVDKVHVAYAITRKVKDETNAAMKALAEVTCKFHLDGEMDATEVTPLLEIARQAAEDLRGQKEELEKLLEFQSGEGLPSMGRNAGSPLEA